MTETWWNAKQLLGRLRLRLVRKRGRNAVIEAISKPEMQDQLQQVFDGANRASSKARSLEEISDWFVAQTTQSHNPRIWREIWAELKPLLDDVATGAPARSRTSQVGISRSRVSTTGQPAAPRRPPPRPSSGTHPSFSRSHGSLPQQPASRTSTGPTSQQNLRPLAPKPTQTPKPTPRPTLSQTSTGSHARLERLRQQGPKSRPQTPVTPTPRELASMDEISPHETMETVDPLETIETVNDVIPAETSGGPRSHKSSSSNMWLPSTASQSDAASDSLDDLAFECWWETQSVMDSLKFRLSRRGDATQLNLLLGHDEFLEILAESLNDGSVAKTIQEAIDIVHERMKRLQALTPENNWFRAFWHVLSPLLQLRHRYSASFDSLPAPLTEQISEAQKQKAERPLQKPKEMYDWENNNKQWIGFINGVVGQIAHFEEEK